jgi:cytochrome c-type biogenesis protein CcmH/NrfG
VGLISGLLTLPLAPVKGVAWVAEQVYEEADRELYDEGRIRRELGELDRLREEGMISDEEAEHRETDLIERLQIAYARRSEGS